MDSLALWNKPTSFLAIFGHVDQGYFLQLFFEVTQQDCVSSAVKRGKRKFTLAVVSLPNVINLGFHRT